MKYEIQLKATDSTLFNMDYDQCSVKYFPAFSSEDLPRVSEIRLYSKDADSDLKFNYSNSESPTLEIKLRVNEDISEIGKKTADHAKGTITYDISEVHINGYILDSETDQLAAITTLWTPQTTPKEDKGDVYVIVTKGIKDAGQAILEAKKGNVITKSVSDVTAQLVIKSFMAEYKEVFKAPSMVEVMKSNMQVPAKSADKINDIHKRMQEVIKQRQNKVVTKNQGNDLIANMKKNMGITKSGVVEKATTAEQEVALLKRLGKAPKEDMVEKATLSPSEIMKANMQASLDK